MGFNAYKGANGKLGESKCYQTGWGGLELRSRYHLVHQKPPGQPPAGPVAQER